MTMCGLRLLPPFAIARVGSSPRPLDNFTFADDKDNPLGFRTIVPAETLVVNGETGELSRHDPDGIKFKDENDRIRPVAPFLEVFVINDAGNGLEQTPLTMDMLRELGASVAWRVSVANRKVERRTGDPKDRVDAETEWFADHEPHQLVGRSHNFVQGKFIEFGHVRYIKPNQMYPQVRLRFTPARGLIYGPHAPAPDGDRVAAGDTPSEAPSSAKPYVVPDERAIYDATKGRWLKFQPHRGIVKEAADYKGGDRLRLKAARELERRLNGQRPRPDLDPAVAAEVERLLRGGFFPHELREENARLAAETSPPSLYAIDPPAPSWLNDGIAISRGYLDDTCDGIVEVKLTLADGSELRARSRICTGPPAAVPDSLFIRTLADDLEQAIYGPDVPDDEPAGETRARALDTVRRAFETVRFLNVAVANGNPVNGRDPLDFDTMPAEEAFQTERLMRSIFPEHTADTLAIMALHQEVYAALQAGATPWFPRLLRLPNHVTDYTDHGRRQMPAMMCGADGSYLALTYRQIDALRTAASGGQPAPKPRNETAWQMHQQLHHRATGNPVSSTPCTAVGNCTPGLEVDFRAVWRRLFEGIVLREWDNLVVGMDEDFEQLHIPNLTGHRLMAVLVADPRPGGNDEDKVLHMMSPMIGPSPADPETRTTVLATKLNPTGMAPLEWSNGLATVLRDYGGRNRAITCLFTEAPVWESRPEMTGRYLPQNLKVRRFFEEGTAVISPRLAEPGELTQGLCSPWQNDYRECSCYYWASARPDYVNVEPSSSGSSRGDNWLQKERTGEYVPDDYEDARLITYDDLFRDWETLITFPIAGKDARKPK